MKESLYKEQLFTNVQKAINGVVCTTQKSWTPAGKLRLA